MKGLTLSRAHLHFAFSNLHFAFFVLHFEFKLPAKNSEFFYFKYPNRPNMHTWALYLELICSLE